MPKGRRFRPQFNRRTGAAAAIFGLSVCAVYLALVFYLRIDGYLLPGNEVHVPAVPVTLPGTNIGVNVSLPGVSSTTQPWTPASRMNILVLGLDRRPDDPPDQPSRSDTIFIASIDKQEGRVQMLAIPRDLWSEVPYGNKPGDWAEAKINAAYSYGMYYKYPGGGPAAAVAAIQHDFNIKIDHYVVVDWTGFVQLIDAIGGIDINVPEAMTDYGTDVLAAFPDGTVQAGEQHMDGKQALGYSRVRVDGDLKRIERQQLVIKSAASRSVSLGLIAKLPELWSAYHAAFQTDIDSGLIPGFALLAKQLNFDNIESFSLGPATYAGIAEDGELILLPNTGEVYSIIDRFMADPQVRDDAAVIAIEYPDGALEEAKKAKEHMAEYGIPLESIKLVAGASGTPGIFDYTGKQYTAAKLTELFDVRLLNPDGDAPAGTDVVLRMGETIGQKKP